MPSIDEEGSVWTEESPVHEDYRAEYDTLSERYRELYNQKVELLNNLSKEN